MSDEPGATPSSDAPKTSEELPGGEVIWGGPSLFVNIAWIVHTPQWIRLTFGERGRPDEPAHFRAAVTLTLLEAIAFSEKLSETVAQYRAWADDMLKSYQPTEGS
jgi:hypothetical protein